MWICLNRVRPGAQRSDTGTFVHVPMHESKSRHERVGNRACARRVGHPPLGRRQHGGMTEQEGHIEQVVVRVKGVEGSGELTTAVIDVALRDGGEGELRVLLTGQRVQAEFGRDRQTLRAVLLG